MPSLNKSTFFCLLCDLWGGWVLLQLVWGLTSPTWLPIPHSSHGLWKRFIPLILPKCLLDSILALGTQHHKNKSTNTLFVGTLCSYKPIQTGRPPIGRHKIGEWVWWSWLFYMLVYLAFVCRSHFPLFIPSFYYALTSWITNGVGQSYHSMPPGDTMTSVGQNSHSLELYLWA